MTAPVGSMRAELLEMFGSIVDPITVCESCGTVGEWEQQDGRRTCSGCHAGCGVAGCGDAYSEGRSPVEARLWRLGRHAQSGDQAAMLAFQAALANYEKSAA